MNVLIGRETLYKRSKIISIFIVLVLVVSLIGCGDSKEDKKIKKAKDTDKFYSSITLEYTCDYSEDLAWAILHDEKKDTSQYGVLDKKGKVQFIFSDLETDSVTVTSFSNGYGYVQTEDFLYVIDKRGIVMNTYPMETTDDKKVVAYEDGYVWIEEYISGFEEAYYKYVLYDATGNCLTEFKHEGTEPIDGVHYYGKGVWGYDTQRDEEAIQLFYCTNSDKWVESNIAHGNHNIHFYEESAVIGMTSEDPDEVGYRAKLYVMNSDGDLKDVIITGELGWNWSDKNYISEHYCVLEEYNNNLVNYNVSKNQFIKMENKYKDRIQFDSLLDPLIYKNNRIVLPLRGSDDEDYIALFDTEWNMIGKPIKATCFELSEKRLVVSTSEETEEPDTYKDEVTVYDNNGKKLYTLSEMGYYAMTPYKNGVARVLDSEADEIIKQVASKYSNFIYPEEITGSSMMHSEWKYIDENGEFLFEQIDLSAAKTIHLQNEGKK